mgnify:FL=1
MPSTKNPRHLAVQHGVTCDKKPHHGGGYLHGEDDDNPYDIDHLQYCGRCHHALDGQSIGGFAITASTPPKKASQKTRAKLSFAEQLKAAGISFDTEYVFAPRDEHGKPLRRWRFDFRVNGSVNYGPADPNRMPPWMLIAVEIEGALFVGGRHGGAPSIVRDVEKRQAAAVLGWRIIPVTPQQAKNGKALQLVKAALGLEPIDL